MDYGYDYIYEYNYDYPVSHGNGGDAAVTILLTVYLVVLALILAFALASYIFHSIGLYTIGKRIRVLKTLAYGNWCCRSSMALSQEYCLYSFSWQL